MRNVEACTRVGHRGIQGGVSGLGGKEVRGGGEDSKETSRFLHLVGWCLLGGFFYHEDLFPCVLSCSIKIIFLVFINGIMTSILKEHPVYSSGFPGLFK